MFGKGVIGHWCQGGSWAHQDSNPALFCNSIWTSSVNKSSKGMWHKQQTSVQSISFQCEVGEVRSQPHVNAQNGFFQMGIAV